MGSLSIAHWVIVLAIVALVFGTKKIRHLGTDLGGAIKDFKAGLQEGESVASESVLQREPVDAVMDAPRNLTDAKHEFR